MCQQYAATQEPGGTPNGIPGGYNQEKACKCEQFQNIQQNVPLSSSHLECLFNKARCEGNTTTSMVAAYATSPNPNPDMVSAFLNTTNCGDEGIGLKQFQGLYAKVISLKAQLELTQGETLWLLGQPDITSGIDDYCNTPQILDSELNLNA